MWLYVKLTAYRSMMMAFEALTQMIGVTLESRGRHAVRGRGTSSLNYSEE